jgi:hypothetical protein
MGLLWREKMADIDIGYVRLVVAIIKQAIVDAKRELKYGRVGGYSASLFINSEEFIEMCHLIDCDGETIRNRVFRDLGIVRESDRNGLKIED